VTVAAKEVVVTVAVVQAATMEEAVLAAARAAEREEEVKAGVKVVAAMEAGAKVVVQEAAPVEAVEGVAAVAAECTAPSRPRREDCDLCIPGSSSSPRTCPPQQHHLIG